jgi:hypothetical protein
VKIEGQELISRGTISSGRILNSACLAVILTWLFGIDTSGLSVLGVDLPPTELTSAFAVVISFLFVGYAVNWFGDVAAFKKWNKGDLVGGGSLFGKGGSPLRTQIENLIVRIDENQESVEKMVTTQQGRDADTAEVLRHMKAVTKDLEEMRRGVSNLSYYGHFVLFVWNFAVPVSLFGLALWILLYG